MSLVGRAEDFRDGELSSDIKLPEPKQLYDTSLERSDMSLSSLCIMINAAHAYIKVEIGYTNG